MKSKNIRLGKTQRGDDYRYWSVDSSRHPTGTGYKVVPVSAYFEIHSAQMWDPSVGEKMLNRICPGASTATAFASDALDITLPADFNRLSGEQIERLIARREAPTLWRLDPEPLHPPEPFGMIA